MIFTDKTFEYFENLRFQLNSAFPGDFLGAPFLYENETFFTAYEAISRGWVKREPQKKIVSDLSIKRAQFKEWENQFVLYGAVGLLPKLSFAMVEENLEHFVLLVKTAKPDATVSYILELAKRLGFQTVTHDIIQLIQLCHGLDAQSEGSLFYKRFQQILTSVAYHKSRKLSSGHDVGHKAKSFLNYQKDQLQMRFELFRELADCTKNRQIRPILRKYGVHQNRYYEFRRRYLLFGVWGLVTLLHSSRIGDKISPEAELSIILERLENPGITAQKMIELFNLGCSRANVQRIYARWNLSDRSKFY
jgi:hypothetical protein